MEKVLHLMLRIPLFTRVGGRKVDIIGAHNEMIDSVGQVAFARFGRPETDKNIEKLRTQIQRGTKTLLVAR